MKTLDKTINPGTVEHRNVFCRIKYDGKRLSITGVHGPSKSGNCYGSCGQIIDTVLQVPYGEYSNGWNIDILNNFVAIWDKWHLNDMNAGTIEQTAFIEEYEKEFPDWRYDYTEACKVLSAAGLNPVMLDGKEYRYGSKWLYVAVPDEVVDFLDSLPVSEIVPPWV